MMDVNRKRYMDLSKGFKKKSITSMLKDKDKHMALLHLKQSKTYDRFVMQFNNKSLAIINQRFILENAIINRKVVDAFTSTSIAIGAGSLRMGDAQGVIDTVDDQNQNEVELDFSGILSGIDEKFNIDDDELEKELEAYITTGEEIEIEKEEEIMDVNLPDAGKTDLIQKNEEDGLEKLKQSLM